MKPRVVCSFSCGAASAVATKIAVRRFENVKIINILVKEEHPDNQRFLKDCEEWIGHPITVIRDEHYGASIYEVFKKKRFIHGPKQTPCFTELKRRVINDWYRPDDEVVIGYTIGEEDRANRFIDANNDRIAHFPLIDAGMTKADCLGLIERAGIELPMMYRLGFNNANCVGCVKGGQAYWNKIKKVFPKRFAKMSAIEQELGASVLRYRSGPKKGQKMPLRELQPTKRKISDEPDISCSAHCELTEMLYGHRDGE